MFMFTAAHREREQLLEDNWGWDEAGEDILSVPSSTSMLDRVLQCIRWVLYVFEVVGVLEQSYRSVMMDMMDRLSTRRRTAVLIPTS